MIEERRSSYRSIMKGTAIFGGVQIFQILITILRGKVVAIFLGPTGSGVIALFTSTTNIITQFSSLGLGFSAVRDISQANESGDFFRMSMVAKVFRRWVWFTGFLGGTISLLFASQFSKLAFNTTEYTWGFVWLSISLFLNALATGENTLLQGTRRLQDIAKASVLGSVVGLVTSIPLFYFFDLAGIVPGIIIASLSTFVVSRHYGKKIKLERASISISTTLVEGQQMVKLGIVLMLSQVIGSVSIYVINAVISNRGGIVDVGLFQSATLITNYSLGLVFNSLAMDYFPRLSAISDDSSKVRQMVNQQCMLVILIVTPLLVGLMIFAPLLIRILLSSKYLPAVPLVQWISLGMILKAASYTLGYISFAKGDKKTFFWLEGVFGNGQTLILNILGYSFWGIEGLGVSFLIGYVNYMLVLILIVYKKYNFRFHNDFFMVFIFQIVFCLVGFAVAKVVENALYSYLMGSVVILFSLFYSWHELEKKIGIKDLIKEKFFRVSKVTID